MTLKEMSPAIAPSQPVGLLLAPKRLAFSKRCQERLLTRMVARLGNAVLAPPATVERLEVAFLDEERRPLGQSSFGHGRLDALSISMRDLFREGLKLNARLMILAHNHPSGDCRPSAYDIAATQRISKVAQSLDIELADHLIFSQKRVLSMRKGAEL